MKKLTTIKFIEKANYVHNGKYNYSKTYYVNNRTVVDIICKEHGLFQQNASNHLAGQNCPICVGRGKGNTKRFVTSAKKTHDNRYDYSLVEYINNKSKIKIICKEHGVFEQSPTRHLTGDGCPKCNGGVKSNRDEFINKVIIIHDNKYDYSLIKYINSQTKVKIICKKHGVFEMKPNHHLSGQGCGKCSVENSVLTTTEFIERAQKVHGSIYDYNLADYKRNNIKVKIICHEHGVFEQTPTCHLSGRG